MVTEMPSRPQTKITNSNEKNVKKTENPLRIPIILFRKEILEQLSRSGRECQISCSHDVFKSFTVSPCETARNRQAF